MSNKNKRRGRNSLPYVIVSVALLIGIVSAIVIGVGTALDTRSSLMSANASTLDGSDSAAVDNTADVDSLLFSNVSDKEYASDGDEGAAEPEPTVEPEPVSQEPEPTETEGDSQAPEASDSEPVDTETVSDHVDEAPSDDVPDYSEAAVEPETVDDGQHEGDPAAKAKPKKNTSSNTNKNTKKNTSTTKKKSEEKKNTDGTTSGPAYSPGKAWIPKFNDGAAAKANDCAIDLSGLSNGYIAVKAKNKGKLKLQVLCGNASYNYDIPNNGTVAYAPINMGNGTYTARVMLNTSGTKYVELAKSSGTAKLGNDRSPYLVPNVYCSYTAKSSCVSKAKELAKGCKTQGDIVRSIYRWMQKNITYDTAKARKLAGGTGYIPNPDSTLKSKKGICFDYSSLAAAMFRSLGIPCKIMTGYVYPDNLYHAWNMVYINGEWKAFDVKISKNTWSRMDTTFAAGGITDFSKLTYSDRYTY